MTNPDERLATILHWAKRVETLWDRLQTAEDYSDDGEAFLLAQQVIILHNWLKEGGSLPKAWEQRRPQWASRCTTPSAHPCSDEATP